MTFAYHHPNYYKKLKLQAPSIKKGRKATSYKPQAPSIKLQASSDKQLVSRR
jgi:hypothetical protein